MNNKSICLNMIVKNEAKVISRCLASVRPWIDHWVIVDTGSTDGTQEIIRKFFQDIPGELHERPWVNFAHNRNEALKLAADSSDYLLFIDADDQIVCSDGFQWPALDQDFYLVEYLHGNMSSRHILLVDQRLNWRWEGVVHEAIDCLEAKKGAVIDKLCVVVSFEGHRSSQDLVQKFQKDARVLEEAIKNEPNNSRYAFHLAGCYEVTGEYEKALAAFEKRAAMRNEETEVYFSLYRVAALQQALGFAPEQFIASYLAAYLKRPIRWEPLYNLAHYFLRADNAWMGYLIAKFAIDHPVQRESYFTKNSLYDHEMSDLYSWCAEKWRGSCHRSV